MIRKQGNKEVGLPTYITCHLTKNGLMVLCI